MKKKPFLRFEYTAQIVKKYGFKKGRHFFLRSLLFPISSTIWFNFIDDYFNKIGFDFVPRYIISAPLRLFLDYHLNCANRIKILTDHYKILTEYFAADIIKNIYSGKGAELLSITGKSGHKYQLGLVYLERLNREGALTLFIKNSVKLAALTFVLCKDEQGNNCLLIGGLQGIWNTESNGKEIIVKSTRDLHGLRPKYAVLECLYAIADYFSVTKIIATSTQNHPIKITNNRRKIAGFHADNDNLWLEICATINKQNNFILPKTLKKRQLEEVPSKKKKDWIARHKHIEEIFMLTKVSLSKFKEV